MATVLPLRAARCAACASPCKFAIRRSIPSSRGSSSAASTRSMSGASTRMSRQPAYCAADLDCHHVPAIRAGAARRLEKSIGVGHRLDIAEDDAQLRLVREVVDEIADLAADLIATGNQLPTLSPSSLIARLIEAHMAPL